MVAGRLAEAALQSKVTKAPSRKTDVKDKPKGNRRRRVRVGAVKMSDLPVHERPRERLFRAGEKALNDRELLAILLGTGTKDMSALGLAEHVLARAGSLRTLATRRPEQLRKIEGVGAAKAARLRAAFELARRLPLQAQTERVAVRHPGDVAALLMEDMRTRDREVFKIVMLDTKHRILTIDTLSIGDLSGTLVHPRELFKNVIQYSSAAIILVHNHPSGDPEPSPEDLDLTARIVAGGRLLGIEVLDHIIIGDSTYVSLKERGLMHG